MTYVRPGTPAYDAIFAGADLSGSFEVSESSPTYSTVVNAFLDPSFEQLFMRPELVHAGQAQDVRNGMRYVVYDLVVDLSSGALVNLPSPLVTGAMQVAQSAGVERALDDQQVKNLFTAVQGGDPKKIAGAAIGLGLGALAVTVPGVGTLASAIIGLAIGIAQIFTKRKADELKDEKRKADLYYANLPPMQVADAELDQKMVEVLIRPQLRSRDLTAFYEPRFAAPSWVGLEREGGFAFAPGYEANGTQSDKIGREVKAFDVSDTGGLGCIPGTSSITSVLQVSLPHEAVRGLKAGQIDPRSQYEGINGFTRITDTGVWLNTAGRLLGNLWQMMQANADTAKGLTSADRKRLRIHGNFMRYRVHIPRIQTGWKRWAESGIRYIREKCYPWYQQVIDQGVVPEDANLEDFYGTAVFMATGVWGGQVIGGTSANPIYTAYGEPDGYAGFQLPNEPKAYGWPKSPISSLYSGAFLPILSPELWPDHLMHDRYNRGPGGISIRRTLEVARAAQEWELGHTLVSAYVSQADAAFAHDEGLKDRLWKLRAILLQHEDRFAIDMRDVDEQELGIPGMGPADMTWRQQLLDAGVPEKPSMVLPGKLGLPGKPPSYCEAGIPCDLPEPEPPPIPPFPANPFDPTMPVLGAKVVKPGGGKKKSSGAGIAAAAGVAALAAGIGAAIAVSRDQRSRPNRSFSAGGLP